MDEPVAAWATEPRTRSLVIAEYALLSAGVLASVTGLVYLLGG